MVYAFMYVYMYVCMWMGVLVDCCQTMMKNLYHCWTTHSRQTDIACCAKSAVKHQLTN